MEPPFVVEAVTKAAAASGADDAAEDEGGTIRASRMESLERKPSRLRLDRRPVR